MGNKGGEIGAGEEKGRPRKFNRTLNYRFRETGIPIGRLLVNLSTTKTAQSQRSAIFTAAFCSTWRTDKVRELHSSFQTVFWLYSQSKYVLFSHHSFFITCMRMKGHFQLVCQVYNIARLLGPFCFLSRFLWETKSPFFSRDFQDLLRHHYCNISPITGELWDPFWKPYFVWKSHLNKDGDDDDDDDDYYNQTAVKRQSKTSCLFTAKSTRNKGIEELSITAKKEARKTTNRQIRDPIAVSYFFFAWAPLSSLAASPLAPRARPRCSFLHSTVSQKKNKTPLTV